MCAVTRSNDERKQVIICYNVLFLQTPFRCRRLCIKTAKRFCYRNDFYFVCGELVPTQARFALYSLRLYDNNRFPACFSSLHVTMSIMSPTQTTLTGNTQLSVAKAPRMYTKHVSFLYFLFFCKAAPENT